MKAAHFTDVTFARTDCDICVGADTEEAVAFATELGPAGEIVRLAGAEGERRRPQIADALRQIFEQYRRPDGSIWAPSSSWTVRARRDA